MIGPELRFLFLDLAETQSKNSGNRLLVKDKKKKKDLHMTDRLSSLEDLRKRELELRSALAEVLEQPKKLLREPPQTPSQSFEKTFDRLRTEAEDLKLDKDRVAQLAPSIKHLVFEGGGMRGISFGGSIRFMEEYGLDKHIEGLAGSSAGAIVAAAVAVGYTSAEIIEVLSATDFNSFKDNSWGVVFDIIRLFTQYGIHKGMPFTNGFRACLRRKLAMPISRSKKFMNATVKLLSSQGAV